MARSRRTRDVRTDVVRGLLLVSVGAGILAGVNNLPSPLAPAAWDGFGLADLMAGGFPIVAGLAIAWRPRSQTPKRLARRLVILMAAGLGASLAVHGLPLVLTGPLQQLAVATVAVGLLSRQPQRRRLLTGLGLLAVHAWVLWASPLAGSGSLQPGHNAAATLDQLVLGSGGLEPNDPWGVATLPMMIVLVLVGHELGQWLRSRPDGPATAAALFVQSAWLVVAGLGSAVFVPVNRTLATPGWALLSAALVFGVFGAVHLLLHLRAGAVLSGPALVGRHGLPVIVTLTVVGTLVVGDGSGGPWRGLRDGLLQPLAGEHWVWIYVALGALTAVVIARTIDRRNWRLSA
ncbi:MAG: hypothetical protein R3249_05605 [Nitriliruptorales bacterium]|nr:hypothetical protein [Nitriliruptorales bacterium]